MTVHNSMPFYMYADRLFNSLRESYCALKDVCSEFNYQRVSIHVKRYKIMCFWLNSMREQNESCRITKKKRNNS